MLPIEAAEEVRRDVFEGRGGAVEVRGFVSGEVSRRESTEDAILQLSTLRGYPIRPRATPPLFFAHSFILLPLTLRDSSDFLHVFELHPIYRYKATHSIQLQLKQLGDS